ncbi:MAG: hypothetical protein BGO49_01770 [Planctomycetales bacterium 71-10]|nr:MAG: hypothetical protein BGO49_01770 [Planctomycetales bacterium 71-10]
MRLTTFGKFGALAVLGIVTSVTTSKVISIARGSQLQAAPAVPGGGSRTVITRPGDPPPPAVENVGRILGGGSLAWDGPVVQGRTVLLDAKATISDTRPNMQFVWAVRVFVPGDMTSPLYEKTYEDQVFTLGDEQELETTFVDRLELPLPPGQYRLQLTWFGLPPEQGLAGLHDPDTRKEFKGADVIATIVIQD